MSTTHRIATLGLLALLSAPPAVAQTQLPTRPEAVPGDVGTLDSIIPALYQSFSGPKGQPRQRDRFLSLWHPQARLMPTGCNSKGRCDVNVMTAEQWWDLAIKEITDVGITEREITHRTERYGNIAHVFSSYETFQHGEAKPFMRGINSYQLVWDGRRWWVLGVLWQHEGPANPLPPEFERPANP